MYAYAYANVHVYVYAYAYAYARARARARATESCGSDSQESEECSLEWTIPDWAHMAIPNIQCPIDPEMDIPDSTAADSAVSWGHKMDILIVIVMIMLYHILLS